MVLCLWFIDQTSTNLSKRNTYQSLLSLLSLTNDLVIASHHIDMLHNTFNLRKPLLKTQKNRIRWKHNLFTTEDHLPQRKRFYHGLLLSEGIALKAYGSQFDRTRIVYGPLYKLQVERNVDS